MILSPISQVFLVLASTALMLSAQVTREGDVIYQKQEGVALTMDVFTPEKPNGAAVVMIVSGGWKSRHEKVKDDYSKPYTDHGYTVFAVVHGSQPRYKVREIMAFMHRAVRFIRVNAERWGIDPDKIGVTGGSAGGHLSLILATKGGPGDPKAKDPVDRASSAVQAAAVFYPPTDYLNWAEPGDEAVGIGKQERWKPAFGPEAETAEGRQKLGRAMSSIYHISENTAPSFIIHGDADPIVPLFQAQSFQKAARAQGAEVELMVKEGGAHGWPKRKDDEVHFVRWFDQKLLGEAKEEIPNGLLGDWTLNLSTKEPAWLRVLEKDGEPVVYMRLHVGGKGPHRSVMLEDGRLRFPMKVKREHENGPVTTMDTVEIGMVDGKLSGVILGEDRDGPFGRVTFTGKRIPAMPEAPDLSKVRFGHPVSLFNGKDLTGWRLYNPKKINGWSVEDGLLVNNTPKVDFGSTGSYGNIRTEAVFEDFWLHIEFYVEEKRNSGVYLRGMYEAQVVDRDSRMQGLQGVGAVFGKVAPSINAGRPGGEWQSYDLTLVDRHVTVVLNGVKVIDNQPVDGPTGGAINTDPYSPGPIFLQGDHTAVKYRNIYLAPVVRE